MLFFAVGVSCVQQFCVSAANAVYSPFLLQDIAYQSAVFMARQTSPTPHAQPHVTQVHAQLRTPTLNSLVQKCLQLLDIIPRCKT